MTTTDRKNDTFCIAERLRHTATQCHDWALSAIGADETTATALHGAIRRDLDYLEDQVQQLREALS